MKVKINLAKLLSNYLKNQDKKENLTKSNLVVDKGDFLSLGRLNSSGKTMLTGAMLNYLFPDN